MRDRTARLVPSLGIAAGVLLAAGLATAQDDASKPETTPPPKRTVLVELFTSQG